QIRRSEIMQLHGEWSGGLEEASRASEWLSQSKENAAAAAAVYQVAELYRLNGDCTRAEEAYREASQLGRDPQPGLSLLRLARGEVDSARISIHHALQEAKSPKARLRLLPSFIEIAMTAKDIQPAQQAVD